MSSKICEVQSKTVTQVFLRWGDVAVTFCIKLQSKSDGFTSVDLLDSTVSQAQSPDTQAHTQALQTNLSTRRNWLNGQHSSDQASRFNWNGFNC